MGKKYNNKNIIKNEKKVNKLTEISLIDSKTNKKIKSYTKEPINNKKLNIKYQNITFLKNPHTTTITHFFFIQFKKYFITASKEKISLYNSTDLKLENSISLYKEPKFIIELSNGIIITASHSNIIYFNLVNNPKKNLQFNVLKEILLEFEYQGINGLFEIDSKSYLICKPSYIEIYNSTDFNRNKKIDFNGKIPINYEEYGTEYKSSYLLNDKKTLMIFSHTEYYLFDIINEKKILSQKLIEYKIPKIINNDNDTIIIYSNNYFHIFNIKLLKITKSKKVDNGCNVIIKLNYKEYISIGGNGIIEIFDLKTFSNVTKINLYKCQINSIFEVTENKIIFNIDKNKMAMINYIIGVVIYEIYIKNSRYLRKGLLMPNEKLLLGCANNFVLFE